MHSKAQTVLLVVADWELRAEADAALREEFSIEVFDASPAALERAAERTPAVVVVDANVAASSALVARIRASSPTLRAVFLGTGRAGEEARLFSLGVVLPRPVDGARLAQAVRNAIRLHGMSENVERLKRTTGQFATMRPDPRALGPATWSEHPAPSLGKPPAPET